MASTLPDVTLEANSTSEMPIMHSEPISIETPARFKGKARLKQSLQRIASSPSLAQFGRRRAADSPYSGSRIALSCVSLASAGTPTNFDNSYSSNSSGGGYSTAPTSISSTPGQETPFINGADGRMAIRRVEYGMNGVPAGASTPTSAVPVNVRPISRGVLSPLATSSTMPEILEDYFSLPLPTPKPIRMRRSNLNFWGEMPHEVKLAILAHLEPKELVRVSRVSKLFYKACFDGQLWTCFDASDFYRDIPAESLAKIIVKAGPFIKELNLRGCVQVEHYKRADLIVKACRNLKNATFEGCRNFQRSTLHSLLKVNERLVDLNLTGLMAVTNGTCKIIAQSCPSLQSFNVSWCTHMDAKGIKAVILGCPNLRDLRAGEVRGFNDLDLAQSIFETNMLEKLVLSGCCDITDEAFKTMIAGQNPEIDILTELPLVRARRLRFLDLGRCTRLTSAGVKIMTGLVPDMEGLALTGCSALTDSALSSLLATVPRLRYLDLEELSGLTNKLLSEDLAKSPCVDTLSHLSISYCENLGDTGMLPVIHACTKLRTLDMDNTRISDLVLAEAASMVRERSSRTTTSGLPPRIGLQLVIYDCQNVTWTGIREVLSRNSEVKKPPFGIQVATMYPTEIIMLRCFYGWQSTVEQVTQRVLRGDLAGAARLERKWGDYMMATEEAGAGGAGSRRRRRRAREAAMLHADEEEGGVGMGGIGRRRRARSNGCAIM